MYVLFDYLTILSKNCTVTLSLNVPPLCRNKSKVQLKHREPHAYVNLLYVCALLTRVVALTMRLHLILNWIDSTVASLWLRGQQQQHKQFKQWPKATKH